MCLLIKNFSLNLFKFCVQIYFFSNHINDFITFTNQHAY